MVFLKILTISDVSQIIKKHSLNQIFLDLITYLESDFKRWSLFKKDPRYAVYGDKGVVELMPTADDMLFSYKYVNGHPENTQIGKQTVIALGQLSDMATGYPLLFSEMTILTAIRTATTAALATKYMAKKNSEILAIIGTGAQSEFQAIAHTLVRPIKQIRYFDIDSSAMAKFKANLADLNVELVACSSAQEAIISSDITVLLTANKHHAGVLQSEWVSKGVHINALGGDSVGKTELHKNVLHLGKVVVEYKPQSKVEGEIQQLTDTESDMCIELWELITKQKECRIADSDITIFDSVGFAIEDFSTLRLFNDLSAQYAIGHNLDMIPQLSNPKDLYSVL